MIRRRYVAALAVAIPLAAAIVLHRFFPSTYEYLSGYLVLVAIAFKGALLSFLSLSKLKLLSFIKGLTLFKGATLLIKRWFLDNIFARWLKRNILDHMSVGLKEFKEYYFSISLWKKIKNTLIALVLLGVFVAIAYISGYLPHLLIFTELKVFVIGVSKSALLVLGKIGGFVFGSWFSPILEVFALSYFFSWLEKKLGRDNWLVKILNSIGERINRIIYYFAGINKKYVDPILNQKVSKGAQKFSSSITEYARRKKVAYEYEQFERLEKRIMDGHIDAYYYFDGMEDIKDKKELYTLINQYTKDNLNIVAFVSRDKDGKLVAEDVEDSFYHDIFILEGVASDSENGIDEERLGEPDKTDFWVLNTSDFSATILSESAIFDPKDLPPHSVTMIETESLKDYDNGDIYIKYDNMTQKIIPIY